jgi:hypothetical protein
MIANNNSTEEVMATVVEVVVATAEEVVVGVMSTVTPEAVVEVTEVVDMAVVVPEVIACLTSVLVFRNNSGVSRWMSLLRLATTNKIARSWFHAKI